MIEAAKILLNSNNVILLPHVDADGDSIGSCLAIALALQKLDKNVKIIMEEEIPNVFLFLTGIEDVKVYNENIIKIKDYTAIAVDCGDFKRLGKRDNIFLKADRTINIDHHKTNTFYGDVNIVDPNASSVGEMVIKLIDEFNVDIEKSIAECIYVAIITDTGGFKYSNTTYNTHEAASRLLKTGISVSDISEKVLDTNSFSKLKLIGEIIKNIELHYDGKLALIEVDSDMIEKTGSTYEDCDGLVNIGRNIEGVMVSVLLKNVKGQIKVNLRSNKLVDVSEIAERFSGGGHKQAAGFTSGESSENLKRMILSVLKGKLCTVN